VKSAFLINRTYIRTKRSRSRTVAQCKNWGELISFSRHQSRKSLEGWLYLTYSLYDDRMHVIGECTRRSLSSAVPFLCVWRDRPEERSLVCGSWSRWCRRRGYRGYNRTPKVLNWWKSGQNVRKFGQKCANVRKISVCAFMLQKWHPKWKE